MKRAQVRVRRTTSSRRPSSKLAALVTALAGASAPAQSLTVNSANSPFVIAAPATYGTVTVLDGGVLVANAALDVTGAMVVSNGGLVTIDAAATHVLRLRVGGGLLVDTGGAIDVTGKGLPIGATIDPSTGRKVPAHGSVCGGSHAVRGTCNIGEIPAFDDPTNPVFPGGGGQHSEGGAAACS